MRGVRLLAALLVPWLAAPAFAEQRTDLREFSVGQSVQDLPASGYTGFKCADAPDKTLAGWQDYARCPRDARGLHAVGFRYGEGASPLALVNDSYAGTRVAGQPVLLALLIGDDARVGAIRIRTDPNARLYLHKKAFLFGLQARARYGSEGWVCRDLPPTSGEEPVGGVFIKEHCEKTTPARHLIVDRQLYRLAEQPLKDFIDASELLILPGG